jgi:hypothetical protein
LALFPLRSPTNSSGASIPPLRTCVSLSNAISGHLHKGD